MWDGTRSSETSAGPTYMKRNVVNDDSDKPLQLDDFLKMHDVVSTGGQAKFLIQNGDVKLNGQVETRRRKKLSVGDVVEVDGRRFVVK